MEVAILSFIKYRIGEMAKDFGVPTKTITALVGELFEKPKSGQQVLTEAQLNVLFDVLTQRHQVNSLEETLAAQKTAKAEEKPQEKKPEEPKPAAKAEAKPQAQQSQQPKAQQPQAPAQQQPKADKPKEPERRRERRVIDTSAVTVNANRFDDRVDVLVTERQQNFSGGKQKIGNKNKQPSRNKFAGNKRRNEEQEKMRRLQLEVAKKAPLVVKIPDEITVGELAARMKKTAAEVIKQLIKLGVMASVNQTVDYDTAALVAMELGCKVEKEVIVTIEERLIDDREDTADELQPRSPVVVVMGHVDHGKTSLLDAIRNTNVASGEAGGITQHIGAYTVQINGSPITFLDTPGHAAFTSMRARGAMCTDIAILVVAADDGIMPQTVEAINHAKAANIPIIVAINKMDKHGANPDRIKQQLTEYDLVPEEWGGETVICPISAKTGQGIDELLEMVILTAEVQELKANPNRLAKGVVIEARLDKARGPVATLLVQNGTLKQGDVIIAGTAVGRVRVMTDDKGRTVKTAGPSKPVEITGLAEVPGAGDIFNAVEDERMARQLVEQRKEDLKAAANKTKGKVTLEDLFAQIQEGEMKELNIIVKADVQGSAEAVKASLEKISNEEVRVKVIHAGVGAISENDVLLASTSNAIIVGFNVRPDPVAAASAARAKVDMRMYRVIYDAINEIQDAMKGMLAPKYKEVIIGHAEVRQTYKVSAIGTIAGCYVKDGKITRDAQVRVLRDNIVIHEGQLGSLQRFKDSVKEVAANYECGMSIEKFNDIKEGDIFECFVMEQIKV
ncbi:MAG TPA: translation initiation factor IF-2 [Candidatus Avoscillospira stercorigallinarum]|uniref:Translation initiation factor IF-2 n=1 Tax=Candidatus Avoscillospira stercorigallinarum TaxID=2840708 RepID=A0A9D1CNZ2_9FIRM|nr:translation initiation factor IF-2 [Candidatus Avoscillospira stercorigallinarum]